MNKKPVKPSFFKRVKNRIRLFFWVIIDTFRYKIRLSSRISGILQRRYEAIQDKPEYEWAQPISGSFMRTIRLPSRMIFYTLITLLILFVIWGSFFQIDEFVHAQGEVNPESDLKIINHLEGGVIRGIYVKEGDHVKKGQLLMTLDDTTSQAAYQEALYNYYNSWAHILRLRAQINKTCFELPPEIARFSPRIAAEARKAYQAHKDLIKTEGAALKDQVEEAKSALQETEKRIQNLTRIVGISEEHMELLSSLYKKDLSSKAEYQQAQIELEKQRADLDSAKINLDKLKWAVQEAEQKLSSALVRYEDQDWQYLEEQQRRNSEAKKIIKVSQDKLQRNEIRSPVDGIVQQVVYKTLGASVSADRDLITIIPDRDTLIVNAFVLPQDIGFVRVGQKVSVKITAFDYSIFGSLEGIVERISPDTFKMQQQQGQSPAQGQQSFYRVYVRTSKNYLEFKGHKYRIAPGMTAIVDIITGQRSVLFYLLKPLVKSTTSAMHER